MKLNPRKVTRTHILTLSDSTPKARRRVRKILGLEKGAPITQAQVKSAVSLASARERQHNAPAGGKKKR